MRVLRISVLCLLTVGLLSASLYADKKREEGFFYPDKLPFPEGWQIEQADLDNAYEASQAFPLPTSKCSGAYISPDGYYLTAYHCLLSALGVEEKYLERLAEVAEVVRVPKEDIIGQRYTYWLGGFDAEVVAVGNGFGWFDERTTHEFDQSILDEVSKYIGTDWAILKVDGIEDHPCLVASEETPQDGDYSWTIGFPGRTKRSVGEVTNNRKKLISYGKVKYDASETEFYKSLPQPNQEIAMDFWTDLVERGEYFIVDADGQGGNSGSPTINVHGEVTGVHVQGLLPDQDIAYENYTRYTAGVIDLQFIRQSLGEEKFDEYFTCGM